MGNDSEVEFIFLDPKDDSVVNPSYLSNHLCLDQDYTHNASLRLNESTGVFCPRTHDGWSCWNATPAGDHAFQPCPAFVPGFDFTRMAHKYCTPEGTWYRHPATNKTWSNYTTCIDNDDLRFRQSINNLYIIGYSISVSALVISLAIFCAFRSLRCTRIYIHKNLFSSFIFNNVMWIIWYTTIVKRPDVLLHSAPPCIILHILVQYSLLSNYLWMFCEGLYLHTLLVVAFVKEERLMCWLYAIGWGLPVLLTLTYTTVRATVETSDLAYCWILESASVWILSGPVCFSMLLNLFFLINIVRVLVTKLRAVNNNTDSNHTNFVNGKSDILEYIDSEDVDYVDDDDDEMHVAAEEENIPTMKEVDFSNMVQETKSGLLRLGGGTIGEMWKLSKRLKESKRLKMENRIAYRHVYRLCFKLSLNDEEKKEELPLELFNQDKGGMFFPKKVFMKFIEEVNTTVRLHANSDALKTHGKEMIKVCVRKVKENQKIPFLFREATQSMSEDLVSFSEEAKDMFFKIWLRKLTHGRLQEFISTKSGSLCKGGHTLRDTLFSQVLKNKKKVPKEQKSQTSDCEKVKKGIMRQTKCAKKKEPSQKGKTKKDKQTGILKPKNKPKDDPLKQTSAKKIERKGKCQVPKTKRQETSSNAQTSKSAANN